MNLVLSVACNSFITVFLSFLERERDRTVTYRDRDFLNVSDRDLVHYDRFRPFTVPDRSPFLTVSERFDFQRFRNGQERSW